MFQDYGYLSNLAPPAVVPEPSSLTLCLVTDPAVASALAHWEIRSLRAVDNKAPPVPVSVIVPVKTGSQSGALPRLSRVG